GLTQPVPIPNSFGSQADYASLTAQASITTNASPPQSPPNPHPHLVDYPPSDPAPPKGQIQHSSGGIPVAPDSTKIPSAAVKPFFTYQIVFVPDLTQKH